MSETETRVGKARKIEQSVEDFVISKTKDIEIPSYYDKNNFDDLKELVQDDYYEKYLFIGDAVYEVIEDKRMDDMDIMEAKPNPDGTIDFTLQYYNGGCSFDEAFETALNKLPKNDGDDLEESTY